MGRDEGRDLTATPGRLVGEAFAADDAARMVDVVWHELHRRYEIERSDPST